MRNGLKEIGRRLRKLNLSQRLILGVILVVVIVILVSGVPANVAMWLQLERQVWMRVKDAQSATQALYDAELARLMKRAGLFAGRPTLSRLVQENDLAGLETYLDALQLESNNLDVVQVITPEFQVGDPLEGLPSPAAFIAGHEPYFSDFILLQEPAQLFILAVSEINPANEGDPPRGWVVVARHQTSDEMRLLEAETGLAQSLIVSDRRVATSLPGAPSGALDTALASQVMNTGQPGFMQGAMQSEHYYVGLMPLRDSQGEVVALSEVALAGNTIRRDMLGTMLASGAISLVVMLAASWVVVRLARTITRPLSQLSLAAEQISQGNLENASPADSGIPEIDQLARQFDLARRQVRQALSVADSEMKHAQRLLASVREGVVALDVAGRITYFNEDAEHILGYQTEKVLYHHYSNIFPHAPGETTGVSNILSDPESNSKAQRVNILDGRGRPLLLSVHVKCIADNPAENKLGECVLVIRDVTEEEAANRLRISFLANVAHEFRTPLAGIAATSELLVDDAERLSPQELAELVGTVQLCTLHLQTLVDNLLESTTIEAGVFKIYRRPIHILDVVNRSVNLIAPLINRRRQELAVSAPAGLPTIWADANRLTQVLVNLFSNASKFSPSGGKIELVVSQHPDWLKIAVLDCGPGLPAGLFADLFKRFATDNQPHETHYGIGLGLSVVKTIVELHDGQVGAENRPEGGAKVWFTIPFHPPEEIEHP